MAVLFTADTHFGHAGARALYRRPFASVVDMDQAMIENWNAVVGAHDEVWHLGDFAIRQKPERVAELLHALNGTKHLITGNNDTEATTASGAWTSVRAYAEIAVNGFHLVLCHYAFRTWHNMGKGWLDLHGHSHGRLAPLPRQCDVGVDAWAFRPVTLGEIRERRARGRAPVADGPRPHGASLEPPPHPGPLPAPGAEREVSRPVIPSRKRRC